MADGMKMEFKGLDYQTRKINKMIKDQVPKVTAKGLMAAGLLIKSRAIKRTPVLTGHLRGSAFTVPIKKGQVQVIGYMASYAPVIHETNYNYKMPGTSWKFLQKAMARSGKDVVDMLQKYYKAGLK